VALAALFHAFKASFYGKYGRIIRIFQNKEKGQFWQKKGILPPNLTKNPLFLPQNLPIYGLKANSRTDQNHQ
jgi:hypothetical protein